MAFSCPYCNEAAPPFTWQPVARTCTAPLRNGDTCGGLVCAACGRCQMNSRHQIKETAA